MDLTRVEVRKAVEEVSGITVRLQVSLVASSFNQVTIILFQAHNLRKFSIEPYLTLCDFIGVAYFRELRRHLRSMVLCSQVGISEEDA